MKKLLLTVVTASVLATSTGVALAQQNSNTQDSMDKSMQFIESYEFSHIREAEWEDYSRIDVEGFLKDGWFAEVRFDSEGNVVREERERLITGSWGLTPSQFKQLLNRGTKAGMVRFDEFEVNDRGEIELEGYNQNDQDIEIKLMLNDLN